MLWARLGTGAGLVILLVAVATAQTTEDQVCVATEPETAGQKVGYELIDLMRREAWVTVDWTLEAYAEFSPGLTSWNWIKNDPRVGDAARASVLRSPECDKDGEFTFTTMFDRSFFHIANLVRIGPRHGDAGDLREGGVLKYHRLEFEAGQTVSLLTSPEADTFVRVNRPVGAAGMLPGLPEGWSVIDVVLETPWQADLFGEVRVLQLRDGTSYQGPIEAPALRTVSKSHLDETKE